MEAAIGSVLMEKSDTNSPPEEIYATVNDALNNYFFRGRFEMLPVYLNLEGEAESELANAFGINPSKLGDFIGLCAANSLQFHKTNPYIEQERWLKEWSKTDRQEPPPFTALLCALSIAAERMGVDENFSPNNYYKRLCDLFSAKDETDQRKVSSYGKSTRKFWDALNLWLTENDFMLGRPTAKALISKWKYVSYALSQALVREADRKRFVNLFETHHLVPDESVPEAEMALFIDDWMTNRGSTGPTAWLRKLWAANDIRDRVVTAAVDTLATWKNPTHALSEGAKNVQFRWLLSFNSFPREKACLLLTVMRGGQEESLRPATASTDAETEFFLKEGNEPDIRFLGPVESINLDLLLVKTKEFIGDESGISYKYIAKPIVPLARSPEGPAYREVSRARLFEEHIILCHDRWLKKVEEHLARCTRRDYKVLCSSDMQGIPEGWHMLYGVKIVRPDGNADDNLQILNPIGSGAAIACVGGLELSHGTWHTDARPTIRATTEKPDCMLEIVEEQFNEVNEALVSSEVADGFIEVPLDSVEVSPKTNLRAEVKANKTLTGISFSLRNAETPVPRSFGRKRIFHPIVEDTSFSLDVDHISSDTRNGLEGCLIHGDVNEPDIETTNGFVNEQNEIPGGVLEISPEVEWQRSPDAAQLASESCVIRGGHRWVYEAFEKGDNRFKPKIGECRDCHTRVLSRSYKEAKDTWARMYWQHEPDTSRVREETFETDQVRTDFKGDALISLETVYDGLCYLGQGTWKLFQRTVSKASQYPWFSYSFANDLFALGHLETQTAYHSVASDWSVPPPVLVIGRNNKAYIAGFHSTTLLERINEALEHEGACYEPVSPPEKITLHGWGGLAGVDVEALLKDIADPHGRPVAVARGIDVVIAGKLPTLDKVWEHGTAIHVEKPDSLDKFDVRQARWTRVDKLQDPGAYRVGLYGTKYIYRDVDGTMRQVGHRAAKILAARANNARLHRYDPTTSQFIATLGVEPPGLFARALVTSGGKLPRVEAENGRIVYEDVDPVVATLILSKMYGK